MRESKLTSLNVHELVRRYLEAAAVNTCASSTGDHRAANKAHAVLAAAYSELRSRGSEAQHALLPLLEDPDPGVRAWAAAHALEFAPELGETVLEALAAEGGLTGFDAEMTLEVWRGGTLKFP